MWWRVIFCEDSIAIRVEYYNCYTVRETFQETNYRSLCRELGSSWHAAESDYLNGIAVETCRDGAKEIRNCRSSNFYEKAFAEIASLMKDGMVWSEIQLRVSRSCINHASAAILDDVNKQYVDKRAARGRRLRRNLVEAIIPGTARAELF